MSDEADRMEWESGDWTDDYREETYMAQKKAATKKSATKKRAYRRKSKTPAVAAPTPTPTPKANKLELLLKSITEHYPKDPSAPGLAISFIAYKPSSAGRFYVAIRRFRGYAGTQPEVIDSTSAPTLLEAMNTISESWRNWLLKTTATGEFLKLGGRHSEDLAPYTRPEKL